MKIITPILTLIFTADIAYAAPIYLECNVPKLFEKYRNFSVKLDEATGKISHTWKEDSFNADGIYSATSISYKKDDYTFTIDRATLSIELRSELVDASGRKYVFENTGQCSKVEIKNNKI